MQNMIDESKPPKYLRQVTTGRCFGYTVPKGRRPDMAPWTGPLPWEQSQSVPQPEPPAQVQNQPEKQPEPKVKEVSEREATIRAAVKKIDPMNYARPSFNRPAMPKVNAVEALTGFDNVTPEEILNAME